MGYTWHFSLQYNTYNDSRLFYGKKNTSEARATAAATAAAAAATAAACTMFHCSLQYFFTLKQS